MLELDFAYFNLINQEKKGLASRKFFLEMLTPIFYQPRLERLIDLRNINSKGGNITVPLGQNNFSQLNPHLQEHLINKALKLIQDYNIQYMAVDRHLKGCLPQLTNSFSLIFGDNFIKALANQLIAATISKHEIKKIVLVGEIEGMEDFLEVVAGYEIPLSLQSSNPHHYEIMSYRMLYERGCAISNSYVVPEDWELGDMIISFHDEKKQFQIASPSLFYLEFTDDKTNMAPELEENLRLSGISPSFHSLAPILEICLLNKAGFLPANEEQKEAKEQFDGKSFLRLQEVGTNLGIWDAFLDNGF